MIPQQKIQNTNWSKIRASFNKESDKQHNINDVLLVHGQNYEILEGLYHQILQLLMTKMNLLHQLLMMVFLQVQ